jgi:ABC-type uncharacterized transport system ATPase subunit
MLRVDFRTVGKADDILVNILSKIPGANEVKILSDGVVTLNVNSEERIPDMVNALVKEGTAIKAVEPRRATLEDIYLRLQHTGEEN